MIPISTIQTNPLHHENLPRSVLRCGKWVSVFRQNYEDHTLFKSFPFRCKSWDCKRCAKKKSKQYADRMGSLFDGRQLWLYTLTFYHSKTSEETWKNANKAFNRLFTVLRKKYGRFSYVKVIETHRKSNYPHFHIIVDRYFIGSHFGSLIRRAGFGWSTDVRRITSSGAGFYIRKYLSKPWPRKDAAEIRRKLKIRVITFSRDFPPVKRASSGYKLEGFYNSTRSAYEAIRSKRTKYACVMYSEVFKTLNAEELTLILMDIPPGGYKNWGMFTSGRKFYDGNEDQFFYEGEPIVCPLMN